MAWTTPTTRATGDLITAAIWNADLVDNLSYLKTEVDKYGALLVYNTETGTGGVATEVTICTLAVPANTLSTNKSLLGRMSFQFDSAGAGRTFTIRIKYGATTLLTFVSPSIQTNVAPLYGFLDFVLRADGATNAQESLGQYHYSVNAGVGVFGVADQGTSAIDSTSAQNLVITAQVSVNDATYTHKSLVVEGPFTP